MPLKTTHTYKGREIMAASSAEMIRAGLRWYIAATHPTGTPYSEDVCRHYCTLAEARLAIRETAAHQDAMDAEVRS